MTPRLIRIIAFAISAVILLGSLSIWAVSTQQNATVGVGDIYEVEIESNENLTGILEPTGGLSGGIGEGENLFNIMPNKSYPRDSMTGSINLYNAGGIEDDLNSLAIELETGEKSIGNLTLRNGGINFRIDKNTEWNQLLINTTGNGSYTAKKGADSFNLQFMIQIDEVQEGAVSKENITVDTVELDISSTKGGNVTEPGEGTFQYETGTVVDLEAVADVDSPFVEWSGDNGTIANTSSNQTTIEMLDNYSIQAVFDVETYDLTINSTENGSVVEPGEGTFTYDGGQIVGLEALADKGYQFVKWSGDNGTIADTSSNQTTIEMLDNYSITAEFAPLTYNLNIDSTKGGNVTAPGEGTFTYDHGTTVDLEAVSDGTSPFVEWSGDNGTIADTKSNQTTIDMLGNYTITAVFDVKTYDLTINPTQNGSVVEPGEGTFTYDSGQIVGLEAVADKGYQFVKWTGDNGTIADTTANQSTIEMLGNYSITAEFAPITYKLTINSTLGGNVTAPGEGTFEYQQGTIVGLEAIADENYTFVEWTGDNGTIDNTTANQTTIEMLDNYSITAEFLQDPFFDVQIINYDDPVVEGLTVTVDYNVTNTGGLEDTQDIVFTIEDQNGNTVREVIDSGVTLAPGEVYDETFSWTTGDGDAGEYNLTVASEDDEETRTVRVFGTAMEYNTNTNTYNGDPAAWQTHWEATNVNVDGMNQMDLTYNYYLNGAQGPPGPDAEAGVRIQVNGNIVMETTSFGQVSNNWTGTVDVQGLTQVDIQFQYYTETQGGSVSEVTINDAGYEYVDTTTINAIKEFREKDRLQEDSIEIIGDEFERKKRPIRVDKPGLRVNDEIISRDNPFAGGVKYVHIHR